MSGELQHLSHRTGLQTEYGDAFGVHRHVPDATLRRILEAMGIADAGDVAQTGPGVIVVDEGAAAVSLTDGGGADEPVRWTLRCEDGPAVSGETRGSRIDLPNPLPAGYHDLTVDRDGGTERVLVIAAPQRCYRPPALENERRWGLTIQLYAVRSARNWGIGDFTDLRTIVEGVAHLGAAVVGVNPLHALFSADPEAASPYSPNSRLFLNTLYIDVEAVPDFTASPEARALLISAPFQAQLESARQAALVDYASVTACKHTALALLYRRFQQTELGDTTSSRGHAFRAFQAAGGASLRDFATFEARDAAVEYHEYLQWEADRQLALVQKAARAAGMSLGLYRDLAVGASGSGAEANSNRASLVPDVHVGAPPDPWNSLGQDWGFPPFNPHRLRATGYRPLRDLLAANMRHTGALRIDHILGFMRLFWIPAGAPPGDGTYAAYPWNEMRAVLAVESHRHHCLVIGEDLGTVPPGFDAMLRAAGILSTRLFYFEKTGDGRFKAPQDYPVEALVAVGTHDLPTFAAYWHGADLDLRTRLALWSSDAQRDRELAARNADRAAVMGFVSGAHVNEVPAAPPMAEVYEALADVPSRLLMVQIEDIAGQIEQVNVPGTWRAYPNWRVRLPTDIADLLADPVLLALARALAASRSDSQNTAVVATA